MYELTKTGTHYSQDMFASLQTFHAVVESAQAKTSVI